MKYRDPNTGNFKEIFVKALDNLPIGSIIDYDGTEVPEGWEQVRKLNSHYIPINNGTKYGWYLVASGNIELYDNNDFTLLIQGLYNNTGTAIITANICNGNNTNLTLYQFKCLSNTGLDLKNIVLRFNGTNYYLYIKTTGNYQQYVIKVLHSSNFGNTVSSDSNFTEEILNFSEPTVDDIIEEPSGDYIYNPTQPGIVKTKTITNVTLNNWGNIDLDLDLPNQIVLAVQSSISGIYFVPFVGDTGRWYAYNTTVNSGNTSITLKLSGTTNVTVYYIEV